MRGIETGAVVARFPLSERGVAETGGAEVATILFADLRGFTGIAETMAPKALAVWLGWCLDAVVAEITAHGGSVAQIMGDGVMATFAALPSGDADANAAARCALAIAAAVDNLNRRLGRDGWPPVRLRIGLHRGPVTLARFGHGRSGLSTLIGDTVNTAARLQQCDDPASVQHGAACRILLSDPVREAIEDQLPLRPIGSLQLRGKRLPVPVWHLMPDEDALDRAA